MIELFFFPPIEKIHLQKVSFLSENRRCRIGCKGCPEIGQAGSGVGRHWLMCILQVWSRGEKTNKQHNPRCILIYVQNSTSGRKTLPLDSLLIRLGRGFLGCLAILMWVPGLCFRYVPLAFDSSWCSAAGKREGMDLLGADCSWHWKELLEWGLAYRWDYIICIHWHMLEVDKPLLLGLVSLVQMPTMLSFRSKPVLLLYCFWATSKSMDFLWLSQNICIQVLCKRVFHHEQVNARLNHVRITENSMLIMASYARKLSYVNWMEFPKRREQERWKESQLN